MRIRNWVFLQDGKPAFKQRPSSQTGRLIDIAAAQHVWRTLKNAEFDYFAPWRLNQDLLENTFGALLLHCGSNNNPTVGQFVDALKTRTFNDLWYWLLLIVFLYKGFWSSDYYYLNVIMVFCFEELVWCGPFCYQFLTSGKLHSINYVSGYYSGNCLPLCECGKYVNI
jgi:hypothetical protein